jgi:hypothetical protein
MRNRSHTRDKAAKSFAVTISIAATRQDRINISVRPVRSSTNAPAAKAGPNSDAAIN